MSKELYNKVKSFISEIEDLEHWWKFSQTVKDNFTSIKETFDKKVTQLKVPEINDAIEKSQILNKASASLIKDFDLELAAFRTTLLKTQTLAEAAITILTKPLASEAEEVEATDTIKELDTTVTSLETYESLNIHPGLESFIKQAVKASHLVLNAQEEDFKEIIPNLTKVKQSLEDVDGQLNEMKNQSQDRQYALRFAFSDLHRSLVQLSEDFHPEE